MASRLEVRFEQQHQQQTQPPRWLRCKVALDSIVVGTVGDQGLREVAEPYLTAEP